MPVVGQPRRFVQKAFFRVEVDGQHAGSFTKCGPFETEFQMVMQTEGGASSPVDITPSTFKYTNVTLEGALETDSRTLADWNDDQEKGDRTKRNVSVVAVNTTGDDLIRWNLTGCSIVKFTDADFDRSAEGENVQQKVEIAYIKRERKVL